MDYYPYGKTLREYDGGEGDRYLTTNHERDKETGLDYRGARYYDSDVARFLSIDPWQAKYPQWSTYNYVMGNPVMLVDPTGKGPDNADGSSRKEEKRKRLFDKAKELEDRAFDISSHAPLSKFRKEHLNGRAKKLRERALGIKIESPDCSGSSPRSNGGFPGKGGATGAGRKSESEESGSRPIPAIVKPEAFALPMALGSTIPGAVLVAPQPVLMANGVMRDFALYTRASATRIINIWGGANTNPMDPDNSAANAIVIQNALIALGVPAGQLRTVPITSPPPTTMRNDGRQTWPYIWITP